MDGLVPEEYSADDGLLELYDAFINAGKQDNGAEAQEAAFRELCKGMERHQQQEQRQQRAKLRSKMLAKLQSLKATHRTDEVDGEDLLNALVHGSYVTQPHTHISGCR